MSGPVKYPSTLSYKERINLSKDEPFEYKKVYAFSQTTAVWDRLTTDASIRRDRAPQPFQDGFADSTFNLKQSGFISNSVPAVMTQNTVPFKSGKLEMSIGIPIDKQSLLVEQRYRKKYPIDHLAALRPETETISQTLRMVGTYADDRGHAQRLGIHIPSSCPGGRDSYHPDVTTSGYGLSPTLPRSGNLSM
uniref:Uncharacterized protein n=1 Tax=Polytomella parva TaxID=51329 RepID=A0A7S0VCC2_9CHLO|mmetsp:Transcript_34581/g.62290  ORF Transcript_34581/g.62290 Transcript_34581/m.62290 type:complete len:192 (+) Transcript_34581:149-724(+)|eukprot:CAMPEP_0175038870 /NCGR_PEP_ID=MMETSP0052_2-20121109/158_1 /TAXON_ID=51329 ORGANISM="Polytomella parva, Strain SAG 63-3" /NCGR_SAMPLE_ID=MMETSP0052_2 /ASSEMBLY_ACC=CAM_ASM_000194 /LENGTH=191 /DNA_ID=CAMNT_0016300439 /DNA_START=105 /DNA_END=680 /DNA_ORIENTATION=+